jgi:hypothetical protein
MNDGGPAFPTPEILDERRGEVLQYGGPGMSLRDYFAAAALTGMLAHSTRYRPRPGDPVNWHEAISKEAYELADATLEARK